MQQRMSPRTSERPARFSLLVYVASVSHHEKLKSNEKIRNQNPNISTGKTQEETLENVMASRTEAGGITGCITE